MGLETAVCLHVYSPTHILSYKHTLLTKTNTKVRPDVLNLGKPQYKKKRKSSDNVTRGGGPLRTPKLSLADAGGKGGPPLVALSKL